MDFQKATITVIADDKIVSVNGEAHRVRMAMPAELHALRWVPGHPLKGYIERKVGDSHHFQDFGNIEPYVKAWEVAKQEADGDLAKAQKSADDARRAAEALNMRQVEEAQRKNREVQQKAAEEQKALADKMAAEIAARAAENAKAMAEQAAAQRAEQEKRAAFGSALKALADSDHEVIKAMEAKLAAEGALPADLVAQRRAAREIAKAEKQKLA